MLIYLILLSMITILITAILLYPDVSVAGAASGLLVWFNSVLPSLFPFMVLTGLLIRLDILNRLFSFWGRKRAKQRNSAAFLFAALVGLLCGYPMGLKTVADFKNSKQLNSRQASLLISFANQPGPMFILGYALPICDPDRKYSGSFLLSFYGGVILTALFFAVWQQISTKRIQKVTDGVSIRLEEISANRPSFFSAFEDIILSSLTTLAKIGGYMMLFSLITALLKASFPARPDIILVFSGLMEMTSGISETGILPTFIKPYFVLGFISFGGLCVTAQSFSLGQLNSKDQWRYFLSKSLQTLLSLILFYLMTNIF